MSSAVLLLCPLGGHKSCNDTNIGFMWIYVYVATIYHQSWFQLSQLQALSTLKECRAGCSRLPGFQVISIHLGGTGTITCQKLNLNLTFRFWSYPTTHSYIDRSSPHVVEMGKPAPMELQSVSRVESHHSGDWKTCNYKITKTRDEWVGQRLFYCI